MKTYYRPRFLILLVIIIVAVAIVFKPKNIGKPYTPYFDLLNKELKKNTIGRPVVIIDLDLLDSNIAVLKSHIKPPKYYRVVDKSLPSLGLIDYIFSKTGTNKVMCFHQPFLNLWVAHKPDVDLLLGKPMPLSALETFYAQLPDSTSFNPAKQIQWLIDSKERLLQYQDFAHQKNMHLQLNVEIDVGLHRGGVTKTEQLIEMLSVINSDSSHLSFSGFMGYDAHVPEVFFPLGSPQGAYKNVLKYYNEFFVAGKKAFPEMFNKPLTLNGAGSKTYQMYDSDTLLNDLASGSGLLLPSDFDLATLTGHRPAVFIATPVLKKSTGIKIPFLEFLAPLMQWWNPNLQETYFIYGGRWKAKHHNPEGLSSNALYGYSSNQEIVNGSAKTNLSVDDFIFLRPTQSEAVMLEFGNILLVRNHKVVGNWEVFE